MAVFCGIQATNSHLAIVSSLKDFTCALDAMITCLRFNRIRLTTAVWRTLSGSNTDCSYWFVHFQVLFLGLFFIEF